MISINVNKDLIKSRTSTDIDVYILNKNLSFVINVANHLQLPLISSNTYKYTLKISKREKNTYARLKDVTSSTCICATLENINKSTKIPWQTAWFRKNLIFQILTLTLVAVISAYSIKEISSMPKCS